MMCSQDRSPDGLARPRLDEQARAQTGRGDLNRLELGRTLRLDRVEEVHARAERGQERVVDVGPAPRVVDLALLLGPIVEAEGRALARELQACHRGCQPCAVEVMRLERLE